MWQYWFRSTSSCFFITDSTESVFIQQNLTDIFYNGFCRTEVWVQSKLKSECSDINQKLKGILWAYTELSEATCKYL